MRAVVYPLTAGAVSPAEVTPRTDAPRSGRINPAESSPSWAERRCHALEEAASGQRLDFLDLEPSRRKYHSDQRLGPGDRVLGKALACRGPVARKRPSPNSSAAGPRLTVV